MKNIAIHRAATQALISDDEYVLVKFTVWGVDCACAFSQKTEALKWCNTCICYGFCYPLGIFDTDGEVLYSEDFIHEMAYKEQER